MASTEDERSETGKEPTEEVSAGSAEWKAYTYDDIRKELEGIKDLPENALDALTIAAFLCSPMPGPVRAAWKAAAAPVHRLLTALVETGYRRECARMLWEIHTRFERARFFRLVVSGDPPSSGVSLDDSDDPDEGFCYSEPVESVSHSSAIERLGAMPVREPDSEETADAGTEAGQTPPDEPVGAGGARREHYTDFVVLGMRILEEAGRARASEDRRGKALENGSTASRSSLDIMCDVVNTIWSDWSQSDSFRTSDSVRRAYQRGKRELPKNFPWGPFKPDGPETSLIKLLEEHRKKRGALGLGRIWLRRR
jgi:hypothetical protein